MGKRNRTNQQRQREAPRDVRDTVNSGIRKFQATVWRMRFMMLIWATWLTLFLAHESLRPGLVMVPTSLWVICLYANFAREWALQILILIWPQWILNFMFPEERSVADYARKYELMEKHKKHRGGSVIFCSKYGRGVWRGFIKVIFSANDRNKSWAGSFSLQDLRMTGHRCRIKLEPVYAGTQANLLLDLSRLAHLLLIEFSPKGDPIRFVKLLYDDMTMARALSPALTKNQLLDFLINHPALKTPRKLTTFTSELFQAYKALGVDERKLFDAIVFHIPIDDWVQRTKKTHDELLMKVLTYKKDHPENTTASYGSTSNELFRFLRNFHQHGGDSDVTTGDQNIYNMKDLEFVATYQYCSYICKLIHVILEATDMKVMMLEYAWEHYTEYVDLD